VPVVRCVSINSDERGQRKLVSAEWPPEGSKARQLKSDTEIINIPVGSIKDASRLRAIAQSIYEEIGHGEVGGSCETQTLTSFGGSNADPDMLLLRPTDTVELVVDGRALSSRQPAVAELIEDQRRSFEAQVMDVATRLDPAPRFVARDNPNGPGQIFVNQPSDEAMNLGRALVATARSAVVDAIRYFRVSNVRYDWNDRGVRVAFDFQNYVVNRHHEATAPAVRQGTRRTRTIDKKADERKGGKKGQVPGRKPLAAPTLNPLEAPTLPSFPLSGKRRRAS
jgi:hypothetical protein